MFYRGNSLYKSNTFGRNANNYFRCELWRIVPAWTYFKRSDIINGVITRAAYILHEYDKVGSTWWPGFRIIPPKELCCQALRMNGIWAHPQKQSYSLFFRQWRLWSIQNAARHLQEFCIIRELIMNLGDIQSVEDMNTTGPHGLHMLPYYIESRFWLFVFKTF